MMVFALAFSSASGVGFRISRRDRSSGFYLSYACGFLARYLLWCGDRFRPAHTGHSRYRLHVLVRAISIAKTRRKPLMSDIPDLW